MTDIRPDYTKEEIKSLLLSNDEFVKRSLLYVYSLQTRTEQASQSTHLTNSVGFNHCDAKILSSFSEQLMKYKRLSEKQMYISRKKIVKYARQITEHANEVLEQKRLGLA
jgi:hypothetical protein